MKVLKLVSPCCVSVVKRSKELLHIDTPEWSAHYQVFFSIENASQRIPYFQWLLEIWINVHIFIIRCVTYESICYCLKGPVTLLPRFCSFIDLGIESISEGVILVRDNRVFNEPLGRSLRLFACTAHYADYTPGLCWIALVRPLHNVHNLISNKPCAAFYVVRNLF